MDLSSGNESFLGQPIILDGGDDRIEFTNLPAGTYDFEFQLLAQNISNLTATLNGQAATITELGLVSFASLTGTSDSPFVLVLTGTAFVGALNSPTYSGELLVTQIPEPSTLALLAAGVGGIAGVGSSIRRKGKA